MFAEEEQEQQVSPLKAALDEAAAAAEAEGRTKQPGQQFCPCLKFDSSCHEFSHTLISFLAEAQKESCNVLLPLFAAFNLYRLCSSGARRNSHKPNELLELQQFQGKILANLPQAGANSLASKCVTPRNTAAADDGSERWAASHFTNSCAARIRASDPTLSEAMACHMRNSLHGTSMAGISCHLGIMLPA